MPLAIWRQYCAAEVTGGAIDSGHYLAEEAPQAVVAQFRFSADTSFSRPLAHVCSYNGAEARV